MYIMLLYVSMYYIQIILLHIFQSMHNIYCTRLHKYTYFEYYFMQMSLIEYN